MDNEQMINIFGMGMVFGIALAVLALVIGIHVAEKIIEDKNRDDRDSGSKGAG